MKFVIENDNDLAKVTAFIGLCLRHIDNDTLQADDNDNDLFYDITDAVEAYENENYPIGQDEVIEAVFLKVKKIESRLEELEEKLTGTVCPQGDE